jgi:prepilin-type N-terminal cleavage/methylation domain-containing protein
MLKRNSGRTGNRAAGFSLLEMTIVSAIILILASISYISLIPLLKQQRVTNAYNITLGAIRQARDNAVSQRTSYAVTFAPGTTSTAATITVAPTLTGFQGDLSSMTYTLPTDVGFNTVTGIPSSNTPDNYGSGSAAIDFGYTMNGSGYSGGQSTIYFCPDGSSQNTTGAGTCVGSNYWSGGVIYIARQGDILSSRAITLWGGTGRVRGWRLYSATGGGYQWLRQ